MAIQFLPLIQHWLTILACSLVIDVDRVLNSPTLLQFRMTASNNFISSDKGPSSTPAPPPNIQSNHLPCLYNEKIIGTLTLMAACSFEHVCIHLQDYILSPHRTPQTEHLSQWKHVNVFELFSYLNNQLYRIGALCSWSPYTWQSGSWWQLDQQSTLTSCLVLCRIPAEWKCGGHDTAKSWIPSFTFPHGILNYISVHLKPLILCCDISNEFQ